MAIQLGPTQLNGRNIFLQGADTAMVWPQLWPLLLIAGVALPSAAWLFRHRPQ